MCIRKEEDGSVDNLFYERHYLGLCLQTPAVATSINSRVFTTTIPHSTFVEQTGIEPVPTDFQSVAMTSSATVPYYIKCIFVPEEGLEPPNPLGS